MSVEFNASDYDGKVTKEQIDELERLRVVFWNAKQAGSADLDDAREAYQDYADKLLIDLSGKLDPTDKPPIDVEPPKPIEGTPKIGGNEDPDGWQVAHMKKPPEKWKVVDHTAKNIATDFTTDKTAQGYIDWYRWKKHHDQPSPGPHTDRTNLSFTSSGYTSEYHLYAGALDWTKSIGLLIYTDGSVYIDYNNGNPPEDLHWPICGYKKPIEVVVVSQPEQPKEQQQQPGGTKQKKPPIKGKNKTFIVSKDIRSNKNRKPKPQGQTEIEKELGGMEVSSYEEFDV